jgi:hypothetical protein
MVPWPALVPLRAWWLAGQWRRGGPGLFGLFALAPFVLLRATSNDLDIKRIAWGFAVYFAAWWLVALWALIRPETLDLWLLVRVAVFTAAAGTAVALFLERGVSDQMHQFGVVIPNHWRPVMKDPFVARGGWQLVVGGRR